MGRFEQSGPEEVSSRRAGRGRLCFVSGPGRTQTPRCQIAQGIGCPCPEVVSHHDGDTYRTVYTVRFKAALYVLHAFQKKAKQGIATPKQEIDLVKHRLKAAEQHYTDTYGKG